MKKVYESIPPLVLMIISWALVLAALLLRLGQGLALPLLNVLFIVVGLSAFYLPPLLCGMETGEALKRKLLWLMVLAGILILTGDLIRFYLPGILAW
ncbi:MAG: hypothetical protein NTY09_12040 [bacterium]|nr:hypothetical protein [bacterium]